MSVKYAYTINDTHSRNITAIGCNPARREVILGFEDGCMKVWESEPCKFVQSLSPEHHGWVTSIVYWAEIKTFITTGQDGTIMFWSGNSLVDAVYTEEPIYSSIVNQKKCQLLCGTSNGIVLFDLDKYKICKHYINQHDCVRASDHKDIVKCLAFHESRVFSGSFDQKIAIYESGYHGVRQMSPICVKRAHDAGVNHLTVGEDSDHNVWLVTSSFDKSVKIWTADGKLVHKLDEFISPVTGLCFITKNKTIWISAGSSAAAIYEPKSGESVSEFTGTFVQKEGDTLPDYYLQLLFYANEQSLVFGSTNRRSLMAWKFSQSGCVTTFDTGSSVDCLTFTKKSPILLFSSDSSGEITKWERKQTNCFAFSNEPLRAGESMKKLLRKKIAHRKMSQLKKSPNQLLADKQSELTSVKASSGKGYSKLHYCEEMDVIIAASEDSNVYIIGYDEKAFSILLNMVPESTNKSAKSSASNNELNSDAKDSEFNADNDSVAENEVDMDNQVTKRVAGYKCRHVLVEHHSVVTCLTIIPKGTKYSTVYLVTSGWDQRICIWDLVKGELVDVFRNVNSDLWEERELAADDAILDMAYSNDRNELAFSSADRLVYIRRFSPIGSEMVLVGTLQGHTSEVNCVQWWAMKQCWVTASEDGSVRLWQAKGVNECIFALNVGGAVQCLAIDCCSSALLVAVANVLKVYESENFDLVQQNEGHFDAIKSIIHVDDSKESMNSTRDIADVYITCSSDGRISIWNAWHDPNSDAASDTAATAAAAATPRQSRSRAAAAAAATAAAAAARQRRQQQRRQQQLSQQQRQLQQQQLEDGDENAVELWEINVEVKVRQLKAAYYDRALVHAHELPKVKRRVKIK